MRKMQLLREPYGEEYTFIKSKSPSKKPKSNTQLFYEEALEELQAERTEDF